MKQQWHACSIPKIRQTEHLHAPFPREIFPGKLCRELPASSDRQGLNNTFSKTKAWHELSHFLPLNPRIRSRQAEASKPLIREHIHDQSDLPSKKNLLELEAKEKKASAACKGARALGKLLNMEKTWEALCGNLYKNVFHWEETKQSTLLGQWLSKAAYKKEGRVLPGKHHCSMEFSVSMAGSFPGISCPPTRAPPRHPRTPPELLLKEKLSSKKNQFYYYFLHHLPLQSFGPRFNSRKKRQAGHLIPL